MKKIKFLLMVFCALLCTTNLFAAPDERVLELEKEFFYNGDFVKVYNSAIEMEEYAELMVNTENSLIIQLFKNFAKIHLSDISDAMVAEFDKLEAKSVRLFGKDSRYTALTYMLKSKYYSLVNEYDKSIENGNKAVAILNETSPKTLERAYALSNVGYIYVFKSDGASAEKYISSSLTLLKSLKQSKSWIAIHAHAYLASTYTVMGKLIEAAEEIALAFDIIEGVEMNVTMLRFAIMPYGTAVFVYSVAQLYDDAIRLGDELISFMDQLGMQNVFEYGNTLQNVGAAYLAKGDKENGLKYYNQAKVHYEEYGYTKSSQYEMLIKNLGILNK